MKLQTKLVITFASVAILTTLVTYWLYQDYIGTNGKLYSSTNEMCEEFAKSYLRTTKKLNNINDFGGGNADWARAIAIESEINNLCQLDLTDDALENYAPSNIQKYLDDYRHN